MSFFANSDTVSEEESKYQIFSNTISIFEQLKKSKIQVTFDRTSNSDYKKSSKGAHIRIGIKSGKISSKTKLERELAKFVFDSPYDEFADNAKNIRTNTNVRQRQSFIKYIFEIFENLESRRVESCYGHYYLGAGERFIEARPHDAYGKFHDSIKIGRAHV